MISDKPQTGPEAGAGGFPTGRTQFPVKKVVGFHPAQLAAIDLAARRWFGGNSNEAIRAAVKAGLAGWETDPPVDGGACQ